MVGPYRLLCRKCGCRFASATQRRRVCDDCQPRRQKPACLENYLTPGQVDAMLEAAVNLETEPPWVRHPVPCD